MLKSQQGEYLSRRLAPLVLCFAIAACMISVSLGLVTLDLAPITLDLAPITTLTLDWDIQTCLSHTYM